MIQEEELIVTYDQEKADVIAFGFYHHSKRNYASIFSSNWAVVVLLVMVVYNLYQILWLHQQAQYGIWLAFFFSGLFLLSFRVRFLYSILFWPRIRQYAYATLGSTTVRFSKESIKVCSGEEERLFTWKSFDQCRATDRYLFLFTAAGDGFGIPKRTFPLDQEAYDFILFIQHNLSENNKNHGQSTIS